MGCLPNRQNPYQVIKNFNANSLYISKLKLEVLTATPLKNDYTLAGKLHEDIFGFKYKVTSNRTKLPYILDVIKKSKEIETGYSYLLKLKRLYSIDSPNIIKVINSYEDEINFYVVHTITPPLNLYDLMSHKGYMSEKDSAVVVHALLSVLYQMNSKNIFHGEIRPDTIGIETKDASDKKGKEMKIMLNSFGDSANLMIDIKTKIRRLSSVMLNYYTAPEIIRDEKIDNRCDIFSIGCILYLMLMGRPPFYHLDQKKINSSVSSEEAIRFDLIGSEGISPLAKEFLVRLLEKDPAKRITIKEALCHKWLVFSRIEEKYNMVKENSLRQNYQEFRVLDRLKQSVLNFIVNQLESKGKLNDLRSLFLTFDKNRDGVLSYEEFKAGYEKVFGQNLGALELKALIEKIDTDKSGIIEYDEFINATIEESKVMNERNLLSAFNSFDRDKSGKLSMEEVKSLLGTNNHKDVIDLITQVDKNKDGQISFNEFKDCLQIYIKEYSVKSPRKKVSSKKRVSFSKRPSSGKIDK